MGRLSFAVDGLVASPDRRAPALGGGALARYDLVPSEGLSLLAHVGAFGIGSAATNPFTGIEAGGELHLSRSTLEAWLSWTLDRPTGDRPGRSAQRTAAGLIWSPGRAALGATLSGTVFHDSTAVPFDTVFTVAGYAFTSHRARPALARFRYVDAEASADVALGPIRLGAAIGRRIGGTGTGSEAWGRVRSAVPLPVAGLSIELSGGIRPALPERALPRARFVGVGLRWSPGTRAASIAPGSAEALERAERRRDSAPVLEVVRGADGAASRLVLRHVPADDVDIMGDFTDWVPVTLRPNGADTWSTAIDLRPGTWAYLLRIDGGPWAVPEGLPAVRGDFGRETGILVVRPDRD